MECLSSSLFSKRPKLEFLISMIVSLLLNLPKNSTLLFNCNVGYSGHETGLAISNAAAAIGISSLERHITLDRSMYGSDQAASVAVSGLRQLVGGIRKIELALGDGVKSFSEAEKSVAKNLRQHL